MTLYNINAELAAALASIEDAIDPETGELPEGYADYIEALTMRREDAIEQMGLEYKNRTAEAKACREEANALLDRARRLEGSAEHIKAIVASELAGQKFSTGRVSVSFRTVKTAEIVNEAALLDYAEQGHEHLIRYKTPDVNKREVEAALRAGMEIPGAELQIRQSMSIK